MRIRNAATILLTCLCFSPVMAQSPTGWSPIVIPRGEYRATIQATPITQRPGRPLHVYGNTVRLIEQPSDKPIYRRRVIQRVFLGTDQWRNDRS